MWWICQSTWKLEGKVFSCSGVKMVSGRTRQWMGSAELSVGDRAGQLHPLPGFPLPRFHLPFPRLCAGAMSAHTSISDPRWLEQQRAVVRHWQTVFSGDQVSSTGYCIRATVRFSSLWLLQ